MDSSVPDLDEIEARRSTDISCDQWKGIYKRACTLCSRAFSQSGRDGATPPRVHTTSFPEFSELYNLPGESVAMNSEILCAMRVGNIKFLENMKNLETPMGCFKNDKGDSILHIAAAFGHLELVNSIVHKCTSLLLEPNWNDQIPLHLAARAGHSEVVKALLAWVEYLSDRLSEENRERLNPYVLRDKNGNTPLHLALKDFHEKREFLMYQQDSGNLPITLRYVLHFLGPVSFSDSYMRLLPVASKNLTETAACLVNANNCASFLANKDAVSPLYLAVEAGDLLLVDAMLNNHGNNVHENTSNPASQILQLEGRKSLVHAALKSKNIDVLHVILMKDPSLAKERDKDGQTSLSVAASIGFYEGLCMLLDTTSSSIFDCDDDGSFPIHMAVEKGHRGVFTELLKRFPDSIEQLNKKGQNIIHIAAKSGKARSFLMYHIKGVNIMNRLMEEQDVDGNTPLHLATINWRPKTVCMLACSYMTRKNCMNIQNADGLRPLDIAENNLQLDYVFRERMTLMVLLVVDTPRSINWLPTSGMTFRSRVEKVDGGKYKDLVQVLLVVATLVATVTFAAGFTLPGGFNNSAPNSGMAILVDDHNLTKFLFFKAISMYSSILAIVSLIWAQLGDQKLADKAFNLALRSLFVALTFMSAAFYFGVYATIKHNSMLGYILFTLFVIFFNGTIFLLIPLVIPHVSGIPWFRELASFYLFYLLYFVNEDDDEKYYTAD